VIPEGHTSGFRALSLARELLRTRQVPACLVSGVDSYVNSRSLQWLEQHHRLKTDENADGVIPGEAAAAVLVLPSSDSASDAMVQIAGLGFGHEKASVLSDVPLFGLGLTEAAQAALNDASLQMHDIDFRISDVTGEQYGFKEQLLALARLLRRRRQEFPIWHCSEYLGDIGAAAGICQLVVAFYASQKAYAPGSHAICYTSSVLGDRGVAVLKGLNSSSRSVSEEP
jgi:3-oxoacyl-[acyl-carrier-protein] synthase-1